MTASQITPATYDLLLLRRQKLFLAVPALMFTLFPLLPFVVFSFDQVPPENRPPLGFVFVFWLFAVPFVATILTLPYRLTATPLGNLVFKSLATTRSVAVQDILSIEPASFFFSQVPLSTYSLKHRNGKIRFAGQFTGMHRLLVELAKANPAISIKGC
jgi:hypothetical protein